MKVLCVLGKHQYGDPARGLGIEYAAFVPALERLGHEVVHLESWDREVYRDYRTLNARLLAVVEKEKPQVLLSVQKDIELWTETLDIVSSRGDVATVSWTTDDSWKYVQVSKYIGPHYHAMTTTYRSMVPRYCRDGMPEVHLTQWAARSDTMQPPIPAKDCRYKVSFVGAAHGNRKQRVEFLRSRGIDVTCFGHGWPNGSVAADEIPLIMRDSVISINFANSRGDNQIKARTFEVPGAGGFLLTEAATDLELFYKPEEEILVFKSDEEAAELIQRTLGNPDTRDRIALAGFNRTKREHTYELRMEKLMAHAQAAAPKWLARMRRPVLPPAEIERRCAETRIVRLLRKGLLTTSTLVWGRSRGRRAARRIAFELSWRLLGAKTFSAAGLPGRIFPQY